MPGQVSVDLVVRHGELDSIPLREECRLECEMKPEMHWLLGYAAYLVWLLAGSVDFVLHRRTDLPHTSGLGESALHLLQLAVIGLALLLCLVFDMGRTIALLLVALVALHAVCGYLDTRWAFGRRLLLPVEQHVHSILDMAPIIGLIWLVVATWPAAVAQGWSPALRQPAPDAPTWGGILLPAIVLCGVPAVLEFRAAWKARAAPNHGARMGS